MNHIIGNDHPNRSEQELHDGIVTLRDLYVEYDRLRRIKVTLKRLVQRDNTASEGGCFLLIGSSGSGKSKFISDFLTLYPTQPHGLLGPLGETADYVPVVRAQVPDNTTRALAANLYTAFTRHKAPVRARRFDLQGAVLHHAAQMQTKLLILEEVSQSIDQKTDRVAAEVATVIKDLLNACIFSILLVGTPEARRLISSSPELARRVLRIYELRPFKWEDQDERETFLQILDAYDDRLTEIIGVRSELSEPEMALRLYAASSGHLGTVAKLLEVAGGFAVDDVLESGRSSLTRKHLSDAHYDVCGYKDAPNPFLVKDIAQFMRFTEMEEARVLDEKPRRRRRS